MLFYRLDQAYTEVGEDDTAFAGRRDPAARRVHHRGRAGTRDAARRAGSGRAELVDALRPLTLDDTTYVNTMSEYDEDRVRASYGAAKYERLARIKGRYDPGNVFHRNINIKPA